MRRGGNSIYTSNDYRWACPYMYINNEWKSLAPYVYINNEWTLMGGAGTQMIKFKTSDGKYLKTSDGKFFLVRQN